MIILIERRFLLFNLISSVFLVRFNTLNCNNNVLQHKKRKHLLVFIVCLYFKINKHKIIYYNRLL